MTNLVVHNPVEFTGNLRVEHPAQAEVIQLPRPFTLGYGKWLDQMDAEDAERHVRAWDAA